MADSTPNIPQIETAQAQKEVTANENFAAASPAMIFARNAVTSAGLTWGYLGGRWGGDLVANGTLALDADSVIYIVADRATGEVSIAGDSSDTPVEWDDVETYGRLYKVTTGSLTVSSWEDHRAGPGGIFSGGGDSGGSSDEGADDRDAVTALSTLSGVVTIDIDLGDYFTLALSANVTSIVFTNLPGSGFGRSLLVQITQDSTPRTVAWPAAFKWENGLAPSVSTGSGAVDLLALSTFDNGTTWRATLAKAFA